MVNLHANVNDSYGNKIILGITKSSICLLCCSLASYSATCPLGMVEQFWTNSPPFVGVFPQNFHVPSCKNLNQGCGVAEGVIAKSLLQKTEKTPKLKV